MFGCYLTLFKSPSEFSVCLKWFLNNFFSGNGYFLHMKLYHINFLLIGKFLTYSALFCKCDLRK